MQDSSIDKITYPDAAYPLSFLLGSLPHPLQGIFSSCPTLHQGPGLSPLSCFAVASYFHPFLNKIASSFILTSSVINPNVYDVTIMHHRNNFISVDL